MSKKLSTKQLVFSAMAIALATVISMLKLAPFPNGGSITLFSMLVVCLIGYWYGPKTGIIAAISYGIIQFLIEPYFVHPAQVLLDYPLAFGALGLSGLFSNAKNGLLKGYLCGVSGRLFFHIVSGIIFYTAYVGDLHGNLLAIWTGVLYNLSYIVPEAALTIVLLLLPPVKKALSYIKTNALS